MSRTSVKRALDGFEAPEFGFVNKVAQKRVSASLRWSVVGPVKGKEEVRYVEWLAWSSALCGSWVEGGGK